MKQNTLFKMMSDVISELRNNRQWGTVHIYQSTYNSFFLFNKENDLSFSALTPSLLKDYEIYLRNKGLKWNTVATYMKVLKAVYNRAVDQEMAVFVPRLFKNVKTAPSVERKKALEAQTMHHILVDDSKHPVGEAEAGRTTRLFFSLMFLLRGISFVDLVHLRKNDIQGSTLRYRRRKTGKEMSVSLTDEALELIRQLSSDNPDSYYLFPFLIHQEGSLEAYKEYQCALRRFNRLLYAFSKHHLEGISLTSYSARHSWATLAYHCEIHPGIISEAMGHSSIVVTETYLKPFQDDRIDQANRTVIDFCRYLRSNRHK